MWLREMSSEYSKQAKGCSSEGDKMTGPAVHLCITFLVKNTIYGPGGFTKAFKYPTVVFLKSVSFFDAPKHNPPLGKHI